jgi:hypothetical protein
MKMLSGQQYYHRSLQDKGDKMKLLQENMFLGDKTNKKLLLREPKIQLDTIKEQVKLEEY